MIDKDDPIIKIFKSNYHQGQITWKGFPNRSLLQMLPSGFTNYQNGTFLYCPNNTNTQLIRALFITKTGRARLSQDTNRDGIYENSQGKNLSCWKI